jgi:hypothetical protein
MSENPECCNPASGNGLATRLKILATFTDRECRMVSATDSYGRILGFLDPLSVQVKLLTIVNQFLLNILKSFRRLGISK